ncbi:MCE family protein [Amycolatopsis suaedae]|uniref:MCE family protein n=1 Tax=Amycolatopsis suaedae TaxID=2510978 RepID=A0A4Q7J8P8_9PSEU|nr:MCE family protein [Amycolatopsis suaedae]RZQ63232.1 MCE family protein [Amycolatopsis suaedae]
MRKERNHAKIGAVTLALIALIAVLTYSSDDLPLLDTDVTYAAYFAEAAGLAPDNEVQVAGVKVGTVTSVELEGRKVRVEFEVAGTRVGDASTAAIEIKTLLGEKFLALRPRGQDSQDPNQVIGLDRTTTPFQLQDAFDRLSTTVGEIDTTQLAQSFTVLQDSLRNTPPHLREALDGLSALSRTVSTRDTELAKLLANTGAVSRTLAQRDTQLRRIIGDGNLLLAELSSRKEAISTLLRGAQQLSEQLTGLVADNRDQLRPALEKLGTVTGILQRNQENLRRSLELLAPFTRIGANATGNGRWFEGYICGLLPPVITVAGATINPEGCTPPIAGPNQGGR